jgi:hypothetical protein
MKAINIITATVLVSAAAFAVAAEPSYDSGRQQRMDEALDHYREGQNVNPNPGPAARTENSIKRGAHRAGSAIENGAKSVGHAVGTGLRKTGDALHRGGEKLQGKSDN